VSAAHSWPIRPAAVALDLLDDQERRVAERLMVEDPSFRAEVERLRATARGLGGLEAELWQPEPPPALDVDRAAVAAAVAGARRPLAHGPRTRAWRSRLRRPPVVLAMAATVLALAVAGVLLARAGSGDDPAAPSTTLALRPLPGVGGGEARLTIAGTDAQLRGSGLRPSGAHDYYEAWLADARGRMVSMGSFRVGADGRVDAHMPVAVDVGRYQLVDVSLEPDDGDPAHSRRSVLRARL
jgi:anti-sigma-K factor RskA